MRKIDFRYKWIAIAVLSFLGSPVMAVAAPHFSFVPATGTLNVGDQLTVKIAVQTETEKSQAMDVWATFDPAKFEIVTDGIVKAADAPANYTFIMTPHIDNAAGRFDIPFSSTVMSDLEASPVSGNLAQVTFRAKAAGTVALNFTCVQNDTRDTNIFRSGTSTDVVTCSANQNGSYTIGSSVAPTPTVASGPTPTSGPPLPTSTPIISNPGSSPTPTLPQTGSVGATIGMIVFGLVMIVGGLMLKVF
jgi:hypothetical protein